MSYGPNQLEEAISRAKARSIKRKARNFTETVEISIGLRDIDLKNPANRITLETLVPNDLGGKSSVAVFAEGDLAVKSKDSGLTTLNRQEIERLAKETKNAKKFANDYSFCRSLCCLVTMGYARIADYDRVLNPHLSFSCYWSEDCVVVSLYEDDLSAALEQEVMLFLYCLLFQVCWSIFSSWIQPSLYEKY